MPTGTYVDMCSKLPVVNPEKITVPTLIMRGQHDGIASFDDLVAFFAKLPNPDKQFAVMPGVSHASFQQKNYMLVYHILLSFFTQPEAVYRGEAARRARHAPSPLGGEGWGEGSDFSIGYNPSPGSLRDPTSPMGEVKRVHGTLVLN